MRTNIIVGLGASVLERYTEKARRAIFFARYEASQYGSPYIESEHLLLGILRENKAMASMFESVTAFSSIREEIAAVTIIREKVSTSVDLPLSNECKRILGYAAEEAERLSHKLIESEHLLLGMLRERDCFAAKLLEKRGVSLESAREQISCQAAEKLGLPPISPGVPGGYSRRQLLYNPASQKLILEMRSGAPDLLPSRIFVRHKDSEVYEQVGSPPEDLAYESAVTCESQPVVVFNCVRCRKPGIGNWAGVYSFDLNSKELALRIATDSLKLESPHGRLWVVELISLCENGEKLYLNTAVERQVPTGAITQYFLASVNLSDPKLVLLSELRDVRF